MILQHNLAGITSGRNMTKNKERLSKNLEKLSSGYRINRAGDDAAGLAISETLRWEIQGVEQAKRNINDGIGLTETADGAMNEINAMLNRARQLSTQAANSTYDEAARDALQEEIDELKAEINRIAVSTKFNDIPLFPQGEKPQSIIESSVEIYPVTFLPSWVKGGQALTDRAQTETYVTKDQIARWEEVTDSTTTSPTTKPKEFKFDIKHAAATLNFADLDADKKKDLIGTGFYCTCLTCDNHYSIKFTEGTGNKTVQSGKHYVYEIGIDDVSISNGESLVNRILTGLSKLTDVTNGIVNPLGHYTMLCADPGDANQLLIYDDRSTEVIPTDIDKIPPNTTVTWDPPWSHREYNINVSTYPQYGRFGPGVAYAPGTWSPPTPPPKPDLYFQIGPSSEEQMAIFLPRVSVDYLEIKNVSVKTVEDANRSVDVLEEAINYLDSERGRIGAYQNRLEHTYKTESVSHENLTMAESRIRDTDVAEEVVSYTKNNLIFQTSQSMLGRANLLPQYVMDLLG